MPHSSGGGSHSGGSHSSSHHSSSHSSSSGSGSSTRYSRRPFRNSRKFRYYDRTGNERFIYSNAYPQKMSLASLIFTLGFLSIFVIAGFFPLKATFSSMFSFRLHPQYISPESHIEDNTGCFPDYENQLEQSLSEFENITGISPYVLSVNDSTWNEEYNYLDEYAYDKYLSLFSDEQHFLIVYSEPDLPDSSGYVDWSWEGIQGNDTDPILTTGKFAKFQTILQRGLENDSMNPEKAFTDAFSDSLSYIMKPSLNFSAILPMLVFVLFWYGITGFTAVSSIKSYIYSRRDYDEVLPVIHKGNPGINDFESFNSYGNNYGSNYGNNYGYTDFNNSGSSRNSSDRYDGPEIR